MIEDTHIDPITVVVDDHAVGRRLDHLLVDHISDMSRSRLQALVRQGFVLIDDVAILDPSAKVKKGDTIVVMVPPPTEAKPKPEAIALDIVYEDDALIVVNKPAGMVVHPAPGNYSGTLVNALLAHCGASLSGIGGVRRPGIVHRLDKDTSGLLVVAKTDQAHQGLAAQFAAHGLDGKLQRSYQAVVWGTFDRPIGTISAALGRAQSNRTKMAVVGDDKGQHAVSHYRVLAAYGDRDGKPIASLVEVQLETGRTHQIRVHMTHIGHPVIGDPLYGAGFKASANRLSPKTQTAITDLKRQALHAISLGFVHPLTNDALQFESALPDDMQTVLQTLQSSS